MLWLNPINREIPASEDSLFWDTTLIVCGITTLEERVGDCPTMLAETSVIIEEGQPKVDGLGGGEGWWMSDWQVNKIFLSCTDETQHSIDRRSWCIFADLVSNLSDFAQEVEHFHPSSSFHNIIFHLCFINTEWTVVCRRLQSGVQVPPWDTNLSRTQLLWCANTNHTKNRSNKFPCKFDVQHLMGKTLVTHTTFWHTLHRMSTILLGSTFLSWNTGTCGVIFLG